MRTQKAREKKRKAQTELFSPSSHAAQLTSKYETAFFPITLQINPDNVHT